MHALSLPDRRHCVVFLSKTLYCHSASLQPGCLNPATEGHPMHSRYRKANDSAFCAYCYFLFLIFRGSLNQQKWPTLPQGVVLLNICSHGVYIDLVSRLIATY